MPASTSPGRRCARRVGLAGLRGATLSRAQVIDLADALAAELGITVAD